MLFTMSALFPNEQHHLCWHAGVCELHKLYLYYASNTPGYLLCDNNIIITTIISFKY